MKSVNKIYRSRFLAYILRHDKKSPIEQGGWLSVDYLISGKEFSYEEIANIVLNDEKMRFEFNDDYTSIRALYGHSVPVDLGLKCKVPPAQLYHGTSTKASIDILESGILPMSRNFVHLSDDKDIAIEVGRRHGDPLIACINTVEMINAGYHFYNPVAHTWLVSKVPSQYFKIECPLLDPFDKESFDKWRNELVQVVCPEDLSNRFQNIQMKFKLTTFRNGIMSFNLGDWVNSDFYIVIDDGSITPEVYEYLRDFRKHVREILLFSQRHIEGFPNIVWDNINNLSVMLCSVLSMVSCCGPAPFDFRDIETMLLKHNREISIEYVGVSAASDCRNVKELFSRLQSLSIGLSHCVIQIQAPLCFDHSHILYEIMQLASEEVSDICTDCNTLLGVVINPQIKNKYHISIYYH